MQLDLYIPKEIPQWYWRAYNITSFLADLSFTFCERPYFFFPAFAGLTGNSLLPSLGVDEISLSVLMVFGQLTNVPTVLNCLILRHEAAATAGRVSRGPIFLLIVIPVCSYGTIAFFKMLPKILLIAALALAYVAAAPAVKEDDISDLIGADEALVHFILTAANDRQKAAEAKLKACAKSCEDRHEMYACWKKCNKDYPYSMRPDIKIPDYAYGDKGKAARRRYLSCANSCTEKRKLLPCYKGCDKLFPFPNKPKIKIPDIAYGGGGGGIPGVTLPNLGELTLPTLPTLPVTVCHLPLVREKEDEDLDMLSEMEELLTSL
ncbi:unnamed protein product [Caenorhabditis auriculariae]|uniref:Uncharacterized protein n=1 Tax=Caenorhabditis auriculariae TaxID=2777116 RepID=A0A8S1HPD6_9PELO|nr:unnamed protein product [Caenorhabditis auriculariae]